MATISPAAANAMLDTLESTIGQSPTLYIFDAAQPTDVLTPDTGNILAEMILPADWMAGATNRSKVLLGVWRDSAANAAGVPAGYAIKQGSTVWMRGSASAVGGGGEIQFTNTPFVVGQQIDVSAFNVNM